MILGYEDEKFVFSFLQDDLQNLAGSRGLCIKRFIKFIEIRNLDNYSGNSKRKKGRPLN